MENKIETANKLWLMLVWIYIAAAVYILLYGDFFLKEIITRKISEMSSNIAFTSTLITIAIMSIALETFPALIDAKGILAVLVAIIICSKITGQLYYSRMKKEIGF